VCAHSRYLELKEVEYDKNKEQLGLAKHTRSEAFCLILYRSSDGKQEEHVWNGRDGGAPSMIYARDGATPLQRADSPLPEYMGPGYHPKLGTRMFVDRSFAKLVALKHQLVRGEWGNPEFQRIVVASLVRKLGPRPSPLAIAHHLTACEYERYRSREVDTVVVDEHELARLKGLRAYSASISMLNESRELSNAKRNGSVRHRRAEAARRVETHS
jgi:hypothetical protein